MIRCSSYIFCNSNQLWDILDSEIITCMKHTINVRILFRVFTPGRRQSKTPILSRNLNRLIQCFRLPFVAKIVRNRVFDCHLSPHWRQMAIENTISIDFDPRSSIIDSVFDCRLSGVAFATKRDGSSAATSFDVNLLLFIYNVSATRFLCLARVGMLCDTNWDSSRENLSSGVSNKVTFEPVSSATETS